MKIFKKFDEFDRKFYDSIYKHHQLFYILFNILDLPKKRDVVIYNKHKIFYNFLTWIIAILTAIGILALMFFLFIVFSTLNTPSVTTYNASPSNIISSKYICWSTMTNPINISSLAFLNNYSDTSISIQQNFILQSTNYSIVKWFQYAYLPFNKYFVTMFWTYGKLTNATDYFFKNLTLSKIPKEVYLNYSFTSNNTTALNFFNLGNGKTYTFHLPSNTTIKVVFKTINPNNTYTFYLPIPSNYFFNNNESVSTIGPLDFGYYTNWNIEVDTNNAVLYNLLNTTSSYHCEKT